MMTEAAMKTMAGSTMKAMTRTAMMAETSRPMTTSVESASVTAEAKASRSGHNNSSSLLRYDHEIHDKTNPFDGLIFIVSQNIKFVKIIFCE